MAHLKRGVADSYGIAVKQPAVRFEFLDRTEAEHAGLPFKLVDPETLVLMRAFDGHAMAARQFRAAGAVIQMAVGEQYLLKPGGAFGQCHLDLLQVAAGIDYRCPPRSLAHQQGTVLLERGDRNDCQLHRRLAAIAR